MVLVSLGKHAGKLTSFTLSSGDSCGSVLVVRAFVAFVRLMCAACHPFSSETEEFWEGCVERRATGLVVWWISGGRMEVI